MKQTQTDEQDMARTQRHRSLPDVRRLMRTLDKLPKVDTNSLFLFLYCHSLTVFFLGKSVDSTANNKRQSE